MRNDRIWCVSALIAYAFIENSKAVSQRQFRGRVGPCDRLFTVEVVG